MRDRWTRWPNGVVARCVSKRGVTTEMKCRSREAVALSRSPEETEPSEE